MKTLFNKFEQEYTKFQSYINNGQVDLIDSKNFEKSGRAVLNLFNQINVKQKELFKASPNEQKNLFSDNFIKKADQGVKLLDTYLTKQAEFAKKNTNLEGLTKELEAQKASLAELNKEWSKLTQGSSVVSTGKGGYLAEQQKQIDRLNAELERYVSQLVKSSSVTASPSGSYSTEYGTLVKILDLKKQINDLDKANQKITGGTRSKASQAILGKADEYQKTIKLIKEANTEISNLKKQKKELNASLSGLDSKSTDFKNTQAQIKEIEQSLSALEVVKNRIRSSNIELKLTKNFGDTTDLTAFFQKARDEIINLRQLGEDTSFLPDSAINEIDELITAIDRAIEKKQKLNDTFDKRAAAESDVKANTEQVKKLQIEIDKLSKANKFTDLVKKLKELNINVDELNVSNVSEFKQQLSNFNSKQLEKVAEALKEMNENAEAAAGAGPTITQGFSQFGDTAKQMAQANSELETLKSQANYFFGLTNSFQLLKRAVQGAYDTIKKLDAAMTETAVVTDFSVGDMWDSLPQYTKIAKELGATTEGAYQTAALYYQQGLDTNEALQLATETMKMARIAGMDYATTTEAMTSA